MFHADLSRHNLPQPQLVEPDPCMRLATRRTAYLTFLRRRIGDPDTAEDVLQDFNLKVIGAASRAAPIRNTDAWLARVLRNTLFDYYRRRDARRRAEAAYASHIEVIDGPVGAESGPVGALWDDAEELVAVEAALARIRPDHAELLRGLYLRGLPRDILARQLGLEAGTLNVRAFRARRALREEVKRLAAGSHAAEKPASSGCGAKKASTGQVRDVTNRSHGQMP